MKQKYLVLVLFSLIIASSATSFSSYRSTEQMVESDLSQALTQALAQQQSDVITQDTIRTFNSHLQIAELRGKATIAVDAKGRQFKAYARCSQATIFSLSDQRPTAVLWTITLMWAAFCFYRYRQHTKQIAGTMQYGGLCYDESENTFYDAQGQPIKLTPMQQQLMEMFFNSGNHQLTKNEFEGYTLTLKVKFQDFQQITRSVTVDHVLRTKDDILPLAKQLLKQVEFSSHPIRLLGLGVSNQKSAVPPSKPRWIQLEIEFKD